MLVRVYVMAAIELCLNEIGDASRETPIAHELFMTARSFANGPRLDYVLSVCSLVCDFFFPKFLARVYNSQTPVRFTMSEVKWRRLKEHNSKASARKTQKLPSIRASSRPPAASRGSLSVVKEDVYDP